MRDSDGCQPPSHLCLPEIFLKKMANSVLPALKTWLLKHESDIAHGINDFSELAPVFVYLIGHQPRKVI